MRSLDYSGVAHIQIFELSYDLTASTKGIKLTLGNEERNLTYGQFKEFVDLNLQALRFLEAEIWPEG